MKERFSIETIECVKCGKIFETLWDIPDGMPLELYCEDCRDDEQDIFIDKL